MDADHDQLTRERGSPAAEAPCVTRAPSARGVGRRARTPAAWMRHPTVAEHIPKWAGDHCRVSYLWKLAFLSPRQRAGLPEPPRPAGPSFHSSVPSRVLPALPHPPSEHRPRSACGASLGLHPSPSTRGGVEAWRRMPRVRGAGSGSTSPAHPGGAAPPAPPSGGLRQPLATPRPTWSPGAALRPRRGPQLQPGCVHAPESWPHHGRVPQHKRDGHTRCPGTIHRSLGAVGTACWCLAFPGTLRPSWVSSAIGHRPVGDPQPCTAPPVLRGSRWACHQDAHLQAAPSRFPGENQANTRHSLWTRPSTAAPTQGAQATSLPPAPPGISDKAASRFRGPRGVVRQMRVSWDHQLILRLSGVPGGHLQLWKPRWREEHGRCPTSGGSRFPDLQGLGPQG